MALYRMFTKSPHPPASVEEDQWQSKSDAQGADGDWPNVDARAMPSAPKRKRKPLQGGV
jgi:hypothetical protein